MSKNYVEKEELLDAIVEYKKKLRAAEDAGDELPIIPDYIGKAFYNISNGIASRSNFSGYPYRDEMVADGIENCVKAINNFDPDITTNPFGYFSKIIWWAFLRRIEAEKKQLYVKHKVMERSMIYDDIVVKKEGDSGGAAYINLDTEYMKDFVETYEEKMESKKTAAKSNKKTGLDKFIGDDKNDEDDEK